MWGGGVVEGSCGVCVVEQQFFNTSHVQEKISEKKRGEGGKWIDVE